MMLLRELISNNSFLEKELGKINSLFLNLQVSGITSNSKEVNLDFISWLVTKLSIRFNFIKL